jgi:hypothetical protein
LNATIQHHVATFPESPAVTELQDNLYVDDFLSGSNSEAETVALIKSSVDILKQAGMPLVKWCSNSPAVAEYLQHDFSDKYVSADSLKVLGMRWLCQQDCFCFDCLEIPEGLVFTKRVVLSYISRVFDPLGFLAPYTMQSKCLFQDIWKAGVDWDEEISKEFSKRFEQWVAGLRLFQAWLIPRCYVASPWNGIQHMQLEGFGDASQHGYGACVYLRVLLSDGTLTSSLVMSKARVAPVKTLTIPRLELMAALLCARLIDFVRKALKLPDISVRCWTDATVALWWIRSSPTKWKQFVLNRVQEIQELTGPRLWFHCPGKDNPADIVSRGASAEDLIHSQIWLKGPEFLVEPGLEPCQDDVENANHDVTLLLVHEETESALVSVDQTVGGVLPVHRWSSLCKAIRVRAWMQRFLNNARRLESERERGELSFRELEKAKVALFRQVQRQEFPEDYALLKDGQVIKKSSPLYKCAPFVDDDGLMRVGGRLQRSSLSYDEKHPILIPKSHLAILLVRFQHSLLKHAGVDLMLTSLRNQFWILGARRIAKQVKKRCVSCQRQDAPASDQPMAPLPEVRVTPAHPFAVTGVDHAGPLYCSDQPGKKLYILLFTCAVTRAVHLELVSALSSTETLMAIRRFVARRGIPRYIYSDNARGFKAMPDLLRGVFLQLTPEWRWIAPASPWWGGFWERLVRSVKSALRKSVGSRSLTYAELLTILLEIEACVNSRPLTFVGDEVDAKAPLTPAHFLLGRSSGVFTKAPEETSSDSCSLGMKFALQKSTVDQFWEQWSSEYIRNLPQFGGQSRGKVEVGSVVLVQGETRHRLSWPLGVVMRVFPGRDGVVRAAEIKTAKGLLTRSIQRLHPLEIASDAVGSMSRAESGAMGEVSPPDVPSGSSDADTPVMQLESEGAASSATTSDDVVDECVSAKHTSDVGFRKTRRGRVVRQPNRLDL